MSDLIRELRRLLDTGAVSRGADYQVRGRVVSAEVDPRGEAARGEVAGSGGRGYVQDIALEWAVDGRLVEVDGACSCPVGWNCKHVVAVLLSLERRLGSRDRSVAGLAQTREAVSREAALWLDRLERTDVEGDDPEACPDGVADRIVYVLDRGEGGAPSIRIFKTRLLKSGAPSTKARPYSFGNAHGGGRFLRPSDRQIMAVLAAWRDAGASWSHGGWDGCSLPEGRGGAWLLSEVLATGRARLGALDGLALSQGAPRQARFIWSKTPSGHQLITADAEDGARLMPLPLAPPWYVDMETGACGPLETGFEPAQAARLAAAPALGPTEAQVVAERLGRVTGWRPPLPAVPDREERRDVRPTPVLRLVRATTLVGSGRGVRRPPFRQPLPGLRVSFDYDGLRCAPSFEDDQPPPLEQATQDRIRVIHRDIAAETAALEDLEAFAHGHDFEPAEDIDLAVVSDDGGRVDFVLPPSVEPADPAGPGAPRPMQVDAALPFLAEAAPKLAALGWRIEEDGDWPVRFVAGAARFSGAVEPTGRDWFSLSLRLHVGDREVDLPPILAQIVAELPEGVLEAPDLERRLEGVDFYPALPDGARFVMQGEAAAPFLALFRELAGLGGEMHLTEAESVRRLAEALEGTDHALVGREALETLVDRLLSLTDPQTVGVPPGLRADLRSYQRQGLGWLLALAEAGFGGVLADDMGLGKTLQALALIVSRRDAPGGDGRPSLAVVPTSLVATWEAQAARFAPDLRVLVLHGSARAGRFDAIDGHDLVITTYPLLHRDHDALFARDWDVAILDEAQAVKNPASALAKLVRRIEARQRIALTGTPMENHLEELWAILDWTNPGLLGTRASFRERYRLPIEREGDALARARLAARTRPFLLRRTKETVAADLPKRTDIVERVTLSAAQRGLYETVRAAMDARVRDALKAKGLAGSRITVLDALLKLRQAACDPALVKLPAARKVTASAKRARLMEMLEALVAEGRKVLVFSQFVEMLRLVEADVAARGWRYAMLTGRTRRRAEAIARFQEGEADVFLISLKAGGTGLTLTAADTVILYDPWWNPATERQAMDRAHRIGQTRPVFVHRLIAEGTVEVAIQDLQAHKQALADAVFDDGRADGFDLDADELLALFEPAAG